MPGGRLRPKAENFKHRCQIKPTTCLTARPVPQPYSPDAFDFVFLVSFGRFRSLFSMVFQAFGGSFAHREQDDSPVQTPNGNRLIWGGVLVPTDVSCPVNASHRKPDPFSSSFPGLGSPCRHHPTGKLRSFQEAFQLSEPHRNPPEFTVIGLVETTRRDSPTLIPQSLAQDQEFQCKTAANIRNSPNSLLKMVFKTAFCLNVVSGCFVDGVSPSSPLP